MAIHKPILIALDTDFNDAVRAASKDKAVAIFSALVGIALSVAPTHSKTLYEMLSKATTVSFAQLHNDRNIVLTLITKNI